MMFGDDEMVVGMKDNPISPCFIPHHEAGHTAGL